MMCLIRYRIGDSPERVKLYQDYESLIRDQFSPEYEIVNSVDFSLSGTYTEKKKKAKSIALRLRTVDDGTLTHKEYIIIAERLRRIARETGTVRMYRECGLIQ